MIKRNLNLNNDLRQKRFQKRFVEKWLKVNYL